MKIYTKTGDDGTTSLIGGTRISKSHIRLESYGTVDELNSWLGLLRSQNIGERHIEQLIEIQNKLFVVGGNLATDTDQVDLSQQLACSRDDIKQLEDEIDKMNKSLPAMKAFILPGGNEAVSYCHLARTVCRRAERRAIELNEIAEVNSNIIKYLNRLSDYLFVLGRSISYEQNVKEVPWILKK